MKKIKKILATALIFGLMFGATTAASAAEKPESSGITTFSIQDPGGGGV